MIDVSFEHWRYTFTEEILRRYGSRHYSRADVGWVLFEEACREATLKDGHHLMFHPDQILCSNEAFPEAAVADPLADLEIWDEWNNGTRAFPYPGRYSKLGITTQEDKTSSPSSIGVIGEIMAGIFAQAGICPWVLVRVVRKWPDFIFSQNNGMYSFVESKAFTTDPEENAEGLPRRVHNQLLREGLIDAMQQLNSDPCGTVWNAYTRIVSVTPTRFEVTFFEINAPDNLRKSRGVGPIPGVVLEGLARRAIEQAAAKLSEAEIERFSKRSSIDRSQTLHRLRSDVVSEIPELLAEAGRRESAVDDNVLVQEEVVDILKRIERKPSRLSTARSTIGRRLSSAKEGAVSSELTLLREVHDRSLFLADLPLESRRQIAADWEPAWEAANRPCGEVAGVPLWRCGGAVFALGALDLSGRHIRGMTRQ